MRDGGLRKLFQKNLPKVHFQPIEIGGTGHGVPDCNFCYQGIEGWIEFKKDTKGRMDIRPEQIGWMIERLRHGGLVRIAVRLETIYSDVLIIFDGSVVEKLESKSIDANLPFAIDFWEGGPKLWNWSEVLDAILLRKSHA
jgi:hypothetical protein